MRLALVSLIALAASGTAIAQPTSTDSAPSASPPPASPPPATAPATPPPAAVPATPPAATPDASGAAPTATGAPAAPAATDATPPAPQAEQTTPPPPPAPPTDPAAIAVLSVLTNVCIPSANGGDINAITKANGLRKSGTDWVMKTRDYTLTVHNPGSNPHQCHVDVLHAVDADSPGKPIVIALNDWAGVENGWSLYRNDKSVQGTLLFTTRSWQLDWNGKLQSLVFTNKRKPDGTPLHNNVDESEMIYETTKSSS